MKINGHDLFRLMLYNFNVQSFKNTTGKQGSSNKGETEILQSEAFVFLNWIHKKNRKSVKELVKKTEISNQKPAYS